MNVFLFVLHIFLTLCLLSLFGLPYLNLLPSTTRLRAPTLLFAPFLGIAHLSFLAHTLFLLDLGTDALALPVTLLSILPAVFLLGSHRVDPDTRRLSVIAVPVVVALIFGILPILILGYTTTIGMEIDSLGYLSRALAIQQHGLLTVLPEVPGHPLMKLSNDFLSAGIRSGDMFVLAYFSSLFHVSPHLVFPVLMAVWYALMPLSVFLYARMSLAVHVGPSLAVALLISCHPLLHWVIIDNFFSHALAISLAFLVPAVLSTVTRRPSVSGGLLSALVIGLLVSVYPTFLPVGLALSAIAGVAAPISALISSTVSSSSRFMTRKRRHRLQVCVLNRIAFVGGSVAASFVLFPVAWFYAIRFARIFSGMVSWRGITPGVGGNIDVFPHPADLFGALNHFSVRTRIPLWQLPRTVLDAVFIGSFFLGVYGCLRRSSGRRLVWLASLATMGAALAYQRFGLNRADGYAYGYFKIETLAAPVATIFFVAGLWRIVADVAHDRPNVPPRLVAVVASVFLLPFVAVSASHLIRTTRIWVRGWTIASSARTGLSALQELPGLSEGVVLLDHGWPGREWDLYFLREVPVIDGLRPKVYPGIPLGSESRVPRFAILADAFPCERLPADSRWCDSLQTRILRREAGFRLVARADHALADLLPFGAADAGRGCSEIGLTVSRTALGVSRSDCGFRARQWLRSPATKLRVTLRALAPGRVSLDSGLIRRHLELIPGINSISIPLQPDRSEIHVVAENPFDIVGVTAY